MLLLHMTTKSASLRQSGVWIFLCPHFLRIDIDN